MARALEFNLRTGLQNLNENNNEFHNFIDIKVQHKIRIRERQCPHDLDISSHNNYGIDEMNSEEVSRIATMSEESRQNSVQPWSFNVGTSVPPNIPGQYLELFIGSLAMWLSKRVGFFTIGSLRRKDLDASRGNVENWRSW